MGTTRAVKALVRGHVQGVNFRSFAQRRAVALGLRGFARNLPDGSTVEVYAEGNEEGLLRLLAELRRGPALARVDAVEETWLEPRSGFEGFEVCW